MADYADFDSLPLFVLIPVILVFLFVLLFGFGMLRFLLKRLSRSSKKKQKVAVLHRDNRPTVVSGSYATKKRPSVVYYTFPKKAPSAPKYGYRNYNLPAIEAASAPARPDSTAVKKPYYYVKTPPEPEKKQKHVEFLPVRLQDASSQNSPRDSNPKSESSRSSSGKRVAFSPETKMPDDYIEAKKMEQLFARSSSVDIDEKNHNSHSESAGAKKSEVQSSKKSSGSTNIYFNPGHRYTTM